VTPLLAITLYMVLQFGIGVWVSRRIRTESDYILAGRNLGYVLTTFSIFATWFGAETIVASAGRSYRDGISLGSAEPFGYALCLFLSGLIFAGPLWRRKLTTLADLYRQRFSPGAERLAAIVLIPGSIYWAAAQIRGFAYVITTSSAAVNAELAIAIAAGFTILYATFGGMLVDAITDVLQGVILLAGLGILFVMVLPLVGSSPDTAAAVAQTPRIHLIPPDESFWTLLERWAIPIGGSVLATELVGRLLAARSVRVATRSAYMAGAMYLGVGMLPLLIGFWGPAIIPAIGDPEMLVPRIARDLLPTVAYAIFAGALISAILSTVDSTLLTSASLLSHNLLVPWFRITDERLKVRLARGGVMVFGGVAYVLARHASGIFELVEQASSFGSAGALVTACFGLFTGWGGPKAAIATLAVSPIAYLASLGAAAATPFLFSLAAALVTYVLVASVEASRPASGVAQPPIH
jgi:Na+/proline symporter